MDPSRRATGASGLARTNHLGPNPAELDGQLQCQEVLAGQRDAAQLLDPLEPLPQRVDVDEERPRAAVVVGRSELVGRPLAAMLIAANATVTVCHSRTRDLAAICREADVLVAALGVPRAIDARHVGTGAVVVDVGISRTEAGLVGDVDFEPVSRVAAAVTPVPGGVGPMTIACLLRNTLLAFERHRG